MKRNDGAAVVLAAGSSERFGADKRLANVNGQPMVLKTLQPYLAQLDSVYVVLRLNDPVQTVLPSTVNVIEARDANLGMGHSLAAAASHLPRLGWLLVGLADMPWIRTDTISQIVNSVSESEDAIVRPSYLGSAGHPVGFTGNYLQDLRKLTGDIGAKQVLSRYQSKVVELPVNDAAILRDVDTPNQIER